MTQVIREFNLNMMKEGSATLVVAKRGSGKSWIIKAIAERFKDYPCAVVFSPTDCSNGFYSEFVPKLFVHSKCNELILHKIVARQRAIMKKKREGKKVDERLLLIMDDCMATATDWKNSKSMKHIVLNGRHDGITLVLSLQFVKGIPPELRDNFDYVFLLACGTEEALGKLAKEYNMYEDRKVFKEVFAEITSDFWSAVILRGRGVKPSESLLKYKAPDLTGSNFVVGSNDYKKFGDNNYCEEWEDRRIIKSRNCPAGIIVRDCGKL